MGAEEAAPAVRDAAGRREDGESRSRCRPREGRFGDHIIAAGEHDDFEFSNYRKSRSMMGDDDDDRY